MAREFAETAHNKTDLKKFGEGMDRVFPLKALPFCDVCEKRHSYCECKKNDDHLYEHQLEPRK
jgi:hypothetical protein